MSEQTSHELPTRLSAFAEVVHQLLDGAKPPKQRIRRYDDEEGLQKHGELRRVVWLSRGGECRAPKQAGGRLSADGTARITLATVRDEPVEVHLFAESKAKTEMLLDSVIAAISLTLRGVVDLGRYEWVSQERENSGRMLRSQYCVLRFTLSLPVPAEVADLHDLTGVEDECGIIAEL